MNDGDRDKAIESLVAEVTVTAYAVVLRHGAGGSWVDLELELWEALARTVQKWDGFSHEDEEPSPTGCASDRMLSVSIPHHDKTCGSSAIVPAQTRIVAE
jgi:hypothetical protein